MKQRIRCPWHAEKTASLVRRKSDYYCYGSCAKAYTLEEVSQKGIALEYEEDDYEKENLNEKLAYIFGLEKKRIRGLQFHADSGGYFIVWPDKSYYKYRTHKGSSKYISPKGYSASLFWARRFLK